ncbi:MAG TPA: glycosyltransferase [Thermoanaerobaculia bacterium]
MRKGTWLWRAVQRVRNWQYRRAWAARAPAGARPAPPLSIVPRDAAPEPKTVVCLPIIEWDFRFQRPQQLMLQFAKHGWRVFYASTAARKTTEKAPNVLEMPLHAVPRAELVVVQHPRWASIARELAGCVVYDCMDDISAFTTESRNDAERLLMADADLVVVTSSRLEQAARRYANRVVLVRNGCDYEHFVKTPRANGARKVAGYYGAISDWFDVELVAQLARRRPDWDFLLVGSTYGADVLPFGDLPNVELAGEQPYADLPRWLARMDVCIIPFKRGPLTEATNPVKVYEMLAAGRPVVSVPIPEVAALAPLVRLASDAGEFEREIVAAFSDDAAEERQAFARSQTWEKRFEELRTAMASALHILLPS